MGKFDSFTNTINVASAFPGLTTRFWTMVKANPEMDRWLADRIDYGCEDASWRLTDALLSLADELLPEFQLDELYDRLKQNRLHAEVNAMFADDELDGWQQMDRLVDHVYSDEQARIDMFRNEY